MLEQEEECRERTEKNMNHTLLEPPVNATGQRLSPLPSSSRALLSLPASPLFPPVKKEECVREFTS